MYICAMKECIEVNEDLFVKIEYSFQDEPITLNFKVTEITELSSDDNHTLASEPMLTG